MTPEPASSMSQQPLKSRQRLRFDVHDRRRDELHDALHEAEFAAQRFDVAGKRGVFGFASVRAAGSSVAGVEADVAATSVSCRERGGGHQRQNYGCASQRHRRPATRRCTLWNGNHQIAGSLRLCLPATACDRRDGTKKARRRYVVATGHNYSLNSAMRKQVQGPSVGVHAGQAPPLISGSSCRKRGPTGDQWLTGLPGR